VQWERLEIERKEITLDLSQGSEGRVRVNEDRKLGVRVFDRGLMGLAAGRGDVDFKELLACAQGSLELGMKSSIALPESGSRVYEDPSPRSDTPAAVHELGMEFIRSVTHPDYILSGKLKMVHVTRRVVNSRGTDLCASESPWSLSLVFKRRGSAGIMDGVVTEEGYGIPDLGIVRTRLEEYYGAFENQVDLPEGQESILLLPDFMDLLGSRFKSEFIARNYMSGSTILNGKLGQQVADEKLTIRDLPPFFMGGCMPFDYEGIIRDPQGFVYMDKGNFRSLACDLRQAEQYSIAPTGNGYRDISTNSFAGMSLTLDPGLRTMAEICGDHDTVIMPELCAGGGYVDSGAFSTPVQLAWLMKNGKPVGRLPQFAFSTDFNALLKGAVVEIASHGVSGNSRCPYVFISAEAALL